MSDQDRRAPPPRHARWILVAGIAFAAAALVSVPLAGVAINDILVGSRGSVSWVTLFAGVTLTGCFFWWLILARARRFTLLRGAIAGVLVAFFSYPVVLAMAEFLQRPVVGALDVSSYGSRGSNIFRTIVTQLTTGFATTPSSPSSAS